MTARRPAGLKLERLEERWAPAIDVAGISGLGTDAVSIVDSDLGKTSNALQIIDDLDTNTTYLRLNNGAEVQLGAAGDLLSSLTIQMGKGNDKVTFSVRGSGGGSIGGSTRFIDLGAGNDSLTVALGEQANVTDALTYSIIGDTSGNDRYSVTGGMIYGGFLFDLSTVAETSGNDKYNFQLRVAYSNGVSILLKDNLGNDSYQGSVESGLSAGFAAQILDSAGNDSYDWKIGGSYNGALSTSITDFNGSDSYALGTLGSGYSTLALSLYEFGTGKNSINFTQGDFHHGSQAISIVSSGAKTSFGGNATLGAFAVSNINLVAVGDARHEISYDDNQLQGVSSSAGVVLSLGNGDDKVWAKFDGSLTKGEVAVGNGSTLNFSLNSAGGDDVFNAAVNGPAMLLNGGSATIVANLGNDDDKAYFTTSKSPIANTAASAVNGQLTVVLNGGAGDDSVKVDLGRFGGIGATFVLTTDLGIGADKFTVAGTYGPDDATNVLVVSALLGDDADKDVFKSTLKVAVAPIVGQETFAVSQIGAGLDVVDIGAPFDDLATLTNL